METKSRWPKLFAKAVEIDAGLRDGLVLDKTPDLHVLRMPPAQATALDEVGMGAGVQADGFGSECGVSVGCEWIACLTALMH